MQQKRQLTAISSGPLPQERRLAILAHLEGRGRVVSSDLARQWGISEDTIRRDIRELDDAGLLHRVHGGALPRSPQVAPYKDRAESNLAEKVRLGVHGAGAIADGMTVLLYGGTTVLEAARRLRPDLRARRSRRSSSAVVSCPIRNSSSEPKPSTTFARFAPTSRSSERVPCTMNSESASAITTKPRCSVRFSPRQTASLPWSRQTSYKPSHRFGSPRLRRSRGSSRPSTRIPPCLPVSAISA